MNKTASTQTSKDIGNKTEAIACRYLEGQGLNLIERNYRCPHGEIDLVMHDKKNLIFIEVRFRRSHRFGTGAESVDYRKQKKLLASVSHYLQALQSPARRSKQSRQAINKPCRLDVISMTCNEQGEIANTNIQWIQNAIEA